MIVPPFFLTPLYFRNYNPSVNFPCGETSHPSAVFREVAHVGESLLLLLRTTSERRETRAAWQTKQLSDVNADSDILAAGRQFRSELLDRQCLRLPRTTAPDAENCATTSD